MAKNLFTPNLQPEPAPQPEQEKVTPAAATTPARDTLTGTLLNAVRYIIIGFAFALPVFFVPGLAGALGFQKALVALGVVTVVVTLLSLLMLRQSRVYSVVPLPGVWFVGFVVVAFVSALVSESPATALRGSVLETGTVAFLAIMAGVMALPLVLQQSKKSVLRALQALMLALFVVLTYTVVRLIFGPVLPLGSFGDVTLSPVGAFNDLAIVAGLVILTSLIALLQLPLRIGVQILLSVMTVLSLVVLAVVNFFFTWVVVGFFGLVVILYLVSRDRLFAELTQDTLAAVRPSRVLPGVTVLVCLVSAWFIITGDTAGAFTSRVFDVSYLEVRPSLTATVDIARGVYSDNLFLGTGPNQFESGWRQYKDASINDTIFWATDFVSGSGFVSTIAVTTGLLGLVTFLLFQAWYAWFGLRMLFTSQSTDRFWYCIGVVTFVGAVFLWGMTYVYVPGATVLLLAALMTGLSFVAHAALIPERIRTIPLVTTQQRGFGLMAAAILLITGSVGVLFTVGQQYVAHSAFAQAQAAATSVAAIDQAALVAYSRYPDDRFLAVRTQVALVEMNRLLSLPEPTESDQQQFVDLSGQALAVAREAVAMSPNNPQHHASLALIYNNLAIAGFQDALDRATSSLATARALDPKNPVYDLVEAQMAAGRGDAAASRAAIITALQQKRNYTEALFLLTQLDIAEGDVESAIANTEAIITLEPRNATRYYQLGILHTSAGNVQQAVGAYTAALTLDPNYANARYLRALLLADAGETGTAVSELRIVAESNQDNAQLQVLISQLESGDFLPSTPTTTTDGGDVPVSDPAPEAAADGTVTSPVGPDTDLVTPLNTVPAEEVTTQEVEISDDSEEDEAQAVAEDTN